MTKEQIRSKWLPIYRRWPQKSLVQALEELRVCKKLAKSASEKMRYQTQMECAQEAMNELRVHIRVKD